MVKISSKASRPEWQPGIRKATEQYAAGVRATHLGGRRYSVPSASTGAAYIVDVANPTTLQASCTCPLLYSAVRSGPAAASRSGPGAAGVCIIPCGSGAAERRRRG